MAPLFLEPNVAVYFTTCVYLQWTMVVSVQEGMCSCPDSKVAAACIHQDVQLMSRRENGRDSLRFICCVHFAKINRFVKLMPGLDCEIDYVQSLKGNQNIFYLGDRHGHINISPNWRSCKQLFLITASSQPHRSQIFISNISVILCIHFSFLVVSCAVSCCP